MFFSASKLIFMISYTSRLKEFVNTHNFRAKESSWIHWHRNWALRQTMVCVGVSWPISRDPKARENDASRAKDDIDVATASIRDFPMKRFHPGEEETIRNWMSFSLEYTIRIIRAIAIYDATISIFLAPCLVTLQFF